MHIEKPQRFLPNGFRYLLDSEQPKKGNYIWNSRAGYWVVLKKDIGRAAGHGISYCRKIKLPLKFRLHYDWAIVGNYGAIQQFLFDYDKNLSFRGSGWYKNYNDTILILPDESGWRLFLWKNYDPRKGLEMILTLEELSNVG